MQEGLKREFQNRIASAGPKDLVLIHLDMILAELDLVKQGIQADDRDRVKSSLQLSQEMLKKLVEALDFTYEVSWDLMAMYEEINATLIKIRVKPDLGRLDQGYQDIKDLRQAFSQVDMPAEMPLVKNGPAVYAGLTYGPDNQLKESVSYQKRGLKA